MRAGQARGIAAEWVGRNAARTPGFGGAFLHGSIVAMADDAVLSAASDVDLMIVRGGLLPDVKPGKTVASGVILDVTDVPWADVGSSEEVLATYHLAGSFRFPSVLADPTGRLRPLNEAVAHGFAERRWVRLRYEDAIGRIERNLGGAETAEHWHDQVMAWLFGTGVMTHVLLVAGLRNPTVRTRYVAVRDLLASLGRADDYERLLAFQGSAELLPERAAHHLDVLAPLFDVAAATIRSPVFFATDIRAESRVIAIDGSRELIARGDHREAVFWIVATYARCLMVLVNDDPSALNRYRPGFDAMLADLGIRGPEDVRDRVQTVRAALPWLRGVAEAIMDATPEIVGDDDPSMEAR